MQVLDSYKKNSQSDHAKVSHQVSNCYYGGHLLPDRDFHYSCCFRRTSVHVTTKHTDNGKVGFQSYVFPPYPAAILHPVPLLLKSCRSCFSGSCTLIVSWGGEQEEVEEEKEGEKRRGGRGGNREEK